MNYVVLDPACGSGNFLYVAYRELRRLEARLREREGELRKKSGLSEQGSLAAFFPLSNLEGIEIDGFAVGLAQWSIWMGHKLAVDELALVGDGRSRSPTSRDPSGRRADDGVAAGRRDHRQPAVPRVAAHARHLGRRLRRDGSRTAFGIGVKDYCVYWFRKAHDHLPAGGRAGLVGTNSISQNRARSASLDYIVENGGVLTTSCQSSPGRAMPWSTSPSQTGSRTQRNHPRPSLWMAWRFPVLPPLFVLQAMGQTEPSG